jgi:hypothetical protein
MTEKPILFEKISWEEYIKNCDHEKLDVISGGEMYRCQRCGKVLSGERWGSE